MGMTPKITLKRINGNIIVTENGKPKVFATLTQAIAHIFEIKTTQKG